MRFHQIPNIQTYVSITDFFPHVSKNLTCVVFPVVSNLISSDFQGQSESRRFPFSPPTKTPRAPEPSW